MPGVIPSARMATRQTASGLLALLLVVRPAPGGAQESTETDDQTVTAAWVGAGQVLISAPRLVVGLEEGVILAPEGATLSTPGFYLTAGELTIDPSGKALLAGDAELSMTMGARAVTASAAWLAASSGKLLLVDGRLTLCSCDPPPWSLGFGELEVQDDGDILVRHGWIAIGGRPVLPVPVLLLRTGREPGLLAPTLGWIAGRGLHASMGAQVPGPAGFDIQARLGWMAPAGMSLEAGLLLPGRRIGAVLFLDPVGSGVDTAWLEGRMWGERRSLAMGLVLDLPLTGHLGRADMPGPGLGVQRKAVSSLSLVMFPSAVGVSILASAGLTRSVHGSSLEGADGGFSVAGTWVRVPALVLALGPVGLKGARLPLTLGGEISHAQLVEVGGSGIDDPLLVTGASLSLAGRWLAARVVDIIAEALWRGALHQWGADGELSRWSQVLSTGVQGEVGIASPTSKGGWSHGLLFSMLYRGSYWSIAGTAFGPYRSKAPPSHLAGVGIHSALRHEGADLLSIDARGWLLVPPGSRVRPMLTASAMLDLGDARLTVDLDLPGSGPSLVTTSLHIEAGHASIVARHVYMGRRSMTHLDIEVWTSGRLSILPVSLPWRQVHLGLLGLQVPLAKGLVLLMQGAIDLDSRRASSGELTLSYSHPCKCLSLGLTVVGRAGMRVPDVLLSIAL